MRCWVGFDDTDNIDASWGTPTLVRWFADEMPAHFVEWGLVRQQLPVHPEIPYTSHNSAAVLVLDIPDRSVVPELIELAGAHVERHSLPGSDPGVCVAVEGDDAVPVLIAFGRLAAVSVTSQAAAYEAARGVHLSGHGGTNDGIIGAAAGVGLTAWGWSGRLKEYKPGEGGLARFGSETTVQALNDAGIEVFPLDRNVVFPVPGDIVRQESGGRMQPHLMAGCPVMALVHDGPGVWRTLGKERLTLCADPHGQAPARQAACAGLAGSSAGHPPSRLAWSRSSASYASTPAGVTTK